MFDSEGNLKEQETSSTEFLGVDVKGFVPGDHNNQPEEESVVSQKFPYEVAVFSAAMLLGAVVHLMSAGIHSEHGLLVDSTGSFY